MIFLPKVLILFVSCVGRLLLDINSEVEISKAKCMNKYTYNMHVCIGTICNTNKVKILLVKKFPRFFFVNEELLYSKKYLFDC